MQSCLHAEMREPYENCQGQNVTPFAGWRGRLCLSFALCSTEHGDHVQSLCPTELQVGHAQAKMREGAGHLMGDGDSRGEKRESQKATKNASSVRRHYVHQCETDSHGVECGSDSSLDRNAMKRRGYSRDRSRIYIPPHGFQPKPPKTYSICPQLTHSPRAVLVLVPALENLPILLLTAQDHTHNRTS